MGCARHPDCAMRGCVTSTPTVLRSDAVHGSVVDTTAIHIFEELPSTENRRRCRRRKWAGHGVVGRRDATQRSVLITRVIRGGLGMKPIVATNPHTLIPRRGYRGRTFIYGLLRRSGGR